MSKGKDGDALGEVLTLPGVELWSGPMAWAGSPLRMVEDWSRGYPANAVFVRGELVLTLSETVSAGMTRQTERATPALIRLENGKAIEVHAPGPDGRCWTYRLEKEGQKSRWKLYAGAAFPAMEPVEAESSSAFTVEYAIIQSILPQRGTGKNTSLRIREDGSAENFASARDPDSRD